MKNANRIKTMLLLIIAGTVSFTVAMWFYSTKSELDALELAVAGFVFITVVFSFFIGIKKLKEAKKGYPIDDEFSLKIKQKAAANAFVYTIYLLTFFIVLFGEKELRVTIVGGVVIIIMGIIFIGLWAYYSKKGIGNGNEN